jgi:hypothetical protein
VVANLSFQGWWSRNLILKLAKEYLPKVGFHRALIISSSTLLIFVIAISRRMVTNQSGHQGPKSSRGGNSRFRRPDRDFDGPPSDSVNAVSVPSALPASIPAPLPGHGFPLLQNGMPMFPPGFSMPSLPPPPPPQQ